MKEQKKFIKKSMLFLVIFLAILLSLNYLYIVISHEKIIYRKEYEWQNYKQQLPNNTLEYAFLGDSHAYNAVNPDYIEGSFIFGTGAEDYTETYYKVRKLLEKDDVKIKTFVLQIDTHTFSDKLRTDERLFIEPGYYSDFVPLKDMSRLKDRSIISVFFDVYFPVLGNGQLILSHFMTGPELTPLNKGWINNTGDYSDLSQTEVHSEKYFLSRFNSLFNNNPDLLENRSVHYFIEIIKLAKANDIDVVFIEYPLSSDYDKEFTKRNLSRELFYEELFKEIDSEIGSETGSSVDSKINDYVVLDYYALYMDKPEYFGDMHHLNYVGSEVFSKMLNEDLKDIRLGRFNSENGAKNYSSENSNSKSIDLKNISKVSILINE